MAGKGMGSTLLGNALELGITHGIPWLAKKGLEAGRYYTSEAMRNPKSQQKAINYAIKKGRPLINEAGKSAINKLADYVEPEKVKKAKREGRWKGRGISKKDIENLRKQGIHLPTYEMFGWIPGSKKGKGLDSSGMVSLEDMVKKLQEIANDPVKYRAYQLDLAN